MRIAALACGLFLRNGMLLADIVVDDDDDVVVAAVVVVVVVVVVVRSTEGAIMVIEIRGSVSTMRPPSIRYFHMF